MRFAKGICIYFARF